MHIAACREKVPKTERRRRRPNQTYIDEGLIHETGTDALALSRVDEVEVLAHHDELERLARLVHHGSHCGLARKRAPVLPLPQDKAVPDLKKSEMSGSVSEPSVRAERKHNGGSSV